jgi:hypothetical protein
VLRSEKPTGTTAEADLERGATTPHDADDTDEATVEGGGEKAKNADDMDEKKEEVSNDHADDEQEHGIQPQR